MEQPIRLKKPDGTIVTTELELYLKGVVPCEVYPSWPDAVLDAQAICARSYAMAAIISSKHHKNGYDVCSEQCCQVFDLNRESGTTSTAVNKTKGIVGMQDYTTVAKMFYSAACGGSTLDHWAPSYLRIVGCPCGPHKEVNGHRQGMCQWGAYYCVKDWNFTTWQQILNHYFDLEYRYDYGQGELVFPNGSDDKPGTLTQFHVWIVENREALNSLDINLDTAIDRIADMQNRLVKLERWILSFCKP